MLHPRFPLRLLALFAVLFGSLVRAQDEEPRHSRWTVEGAYGWAWTYGNDVSLGDEFTARRTSDSDGLLIGRDRVLEPLLTKMRTAGQPFLRVSYDTDRWGFAAEGWWLDTNGSISGTTTSQGGLETTDGAVSGTALPGGVEIWESVFGEPYDLSYRARNELSIWTARVDVTRHLSRRLTVTAGVYGGKLENRRYEELSGETEDLFFALFFDSTERFSDEGRSQMDATFVGPSIGLRFRPNLGERWSFLLCGTQSFLFTRAEQEGHFVDREFYDDFGIFDLPEEFVDTLQTEFSTSSLVPVSELRATAWFALRKHLALGATAFVSVWLDVPQALSFSFRTAWEEPKTTLAFVSVGPIVKVTF